MQFRIPTSPSAGLRSHTRATRCRCPHRPAVSARAGVNHGDYVVVDWKATLDDGTVCVDTRESPTVDTFFQVGSDGILKGLNALVLTMQKGDTKTIRVGPEEAFGRHDPKLIMTMESQASAEEQAIMKERGVVTINTGGSQFNVKVVDMDEKTITIDANNPLADQFVTLEAELQQVISSPQQLQRVTFGAGCFWGVELAMQRLPGVLMTRVGYSNGHKADPTYEEVCGGHTGHAEVVQVTYDSEATTLEALLDTFWASLKDPTQANGQGNDVGSQYRTGVYFHSEDQQAAAVAFLAKKQQAQPSAKIAIEVEPVTNFHAAEPFHQQYLANNGPNPQSAKKGCTDPIRCYG